MRRSGLAGALLLTAASPGAAQQEPAIDSLVAAFIEHGIVASWTPGRLFENCPELEPWQERGFRELSTAALPPKRTADLAHSWAEPLRMCDNRQLEAWFMQRLDEAIAQGEWSSSLALRTAVYYAQTAGVRVYLREGMLNPALPEEVRGTFGAAYFEVLEGNELLEEYLEAFITRNLPLGTDWGVGNRVLHDHGDRLLIRVAELVRRDPLLANQNAFQLLVQGSRGLTTPDTRRALGAALAEGLDNAGVAGALREQLDGAARSLLRSGG
jgi:hypothetical protein